MAGHRDRLAWTKGQRGKQFDWIGAYIREWMSPTSVRGVRIGITTERIVKLRDQCQAFGLYKDRVPRREAR